MKVLKYDTSIEEVKQACWDSPTVFLAGPTVRGNQPHLTSWRIEAVKLFKEKGFRGNLIVPEFPRPSDSDQSRYDLPVWEFNSLVDCDVIMFWVPRTRELIALTTNHELGLWMAQDRRKVVYGRPNDAYRISYLDVMWVEHYRRFYGKPVGDSVAIHTTLSKTIDAVLQNKRLYQEKN